MKSPLFLPWLRRGLARGIGGPDDRSGGSLPSRGSITTSLTLTDSRGVDADVESTLDVVGPGDVTGLDTAHVVRQVPPNGATDVEANYLPFIELAAPDVPWMLTPASADGDNGLRPWFVLVCVEQRDDVIYDAGAQPSPVLRMSAAIAEEELPDLAESWAWGHVQSLVRANDIGAEVEAASGAVTCRLVCPRKLVEGRSYRAAVVPAFDAGVAAGLGQDVSDFDDIAPAWVKGAIANTVELPVYVTWTFSTSVEAGDFESLAKRLEADTEGGRLGYRATSVVDYGLLSPFEEEARFEYEGALVDPGSTGVRLSKTARTWFQSGLTQRLEESASRPQVTRNAPAHYDPEVDDPVLGPPLYGSWAADRFTIPSSGWLRALNLQASRRTAAGLGARIVRDNQEEFLAAAWDQSGEVRALRDELNRARLSAELGRSHARRLSALDDASLLQATGRLQVFTDVGGTTATATIAQSAVMPTAMVTPVFARQTRPGTTLAKRSGRAVGARAVGARVTSQFVTASAPLSERTASLEPVANFGAAYVPPDSITGNTTFQLIEYDYGYAELAATEPVAPIDSATSADVRTIAADVRAALDPMPSIVAGVQARVTGIQLDVNADLPTHVPVGPRFPEGLFPKLHAMGSELVLPGIDSFGLNRVRLLEVNEAWIAAFLAGANHEWAREALWNEYPADLGATAFSTFWPRVPAGTTDLSRDMHEWPLKESLADQVGDAESSSTVLLVRGDVIRRHPDTEFFLAVPDAGGNLLDQHGDIPAERIIWPAFTGYLDAETIFVGFDVDPQVIWDDDYHVAIQEPVVGPRFGLDVADPSHHAATPTTWSDASWGHVSAGPDELAAMTHIRFADVPWLDGVERDDMTWGRNSAHMAGITYQTPFRLVMEASYLMPNPDSKS